jgi:hypothetical protein
MNGRPKRAAKRRCGDFESLEDRQLLSGVAPTVADRRELLSHLTGALHASLAKTLRHSGPDAFDATLLKYMDRRDTANYYFRTKDVAPFLAFDAGSNGRQQRYADKVALADAVIAHRFPLSDGSSQYTVQLGAQINWTEQPAATDDPNFLHTLNRQGFWGELALAYRITGKAAYVREMVSELQSWSAQAKPLAHADDWSKGGTPWWLLDAADRVENWVQAYYFVLGTPAWTPAANTLMLLQLWRHADFLSRVTPGKLAANRTTVHATGLLTLATLFPEFDDAAGWEGQGDKLMFECLQAQFRADGGHVEQSPAYQGLALSAFLREFYLADLNGRPTWSRNNRRRMTNAVESYYQLIDDSRLPPLSDTYRMGGDPRSFFTQAAAVLHDDRYRIVVPDLNDLWVIGLKNVPPSDDSRYYPLVVKDLTYAMPDSGYYVARGNGTLYFDAGPKGGSHGHYDLLSFDLTRGKNIVVADPGPYRYDDSPERAFAISTPAHNTISVDGLNHEAIEAEHDPRIVLDRFKAGDDSIQITAHHHAYEFLPGRPTVGRTIWINRTLSGPFNAAKPVAIVVDWGHSAVPHTFTTSFTLPAAAGVRNAGAREVEPGVVLNPYKSRVYNRIQTLVQPGQTTALEQRPIADAPPPAALTPAARYTVSQKTTDAVFVTMISQWEDRADFTIDPFTIAWDQPPRPGEPLRIRVSDGRPQDTVVLEFAPPDLSPLGVAGASAASAAVPPVPPVPPASPFSAKPIPADGGLFD